jgi:hypothetical protein
MEDRFGSAIAGSAFEVLNGALEIGWRDVGETFGGGLPGCVFHAVAGQGFPITYPDFAERAVAVEDEDRFLGRRHVFDYSRETVATGRG